MPTFTPSIKIWLAIGATALVTALLVGSFVFVWQQNKIKNVETSFLQQQIEDLQNKLTAETASPSPEPIDLAAATSTPASTPTPEASVGTSSEASLNNQADDAEEAKITK